MIPLALILMLLAVVIFIWALRSGQFEDLDGPAISVIMDEDKQQSKDVNVEPAIAQESRQE